jgi:hypothetical protein
VYNRKTSICRYLHGGAFTAKHRRNLLTSLRFQDILWFNFGSSSLIPSFKHALRVSSWRQLQSVWTFFYFSFFSSLHFFVVLSHLTLHDWITYANSYQIFRVNEFIIFLEWKIGLSISGSVVNSTEIKFRLEHKLITEFKQIWEINYKSLLMKKNYAYVY